PIITGPAARRRQKRSAASAAGRCLYWRSVAVVTGPDDALLNAHRKAGDRHHGGWICHRAGAQVEAGAVAWALDFKAAHLPTGQIAAVVGAGVLHREIGAINVVDGNRCVAIPHDGELARQELARLAHTDPAAHAARMPG